MARFVLYVPSESQTETCHHGFESTRPLLSHVSTKQSPLGLRNISYIINHSLIDIWQLVSTPGYATYSWNIFKVESRFCNLKT